MKKTTTIRIARLMLLISCLVFIAGVRLVSEFEITEGRFFALIGAVGIPFFYLAGGS